MNRFGKLMIVGLVVAVCCTALNAQTSKTLADIAQKARSALAVVSFTIKDDTGAKPATGLAICIGQDGTFMSASLPPGMRADLIQNLQLTVPGADGKSFKADLIKIDTVTNLAFLKAQGGQWKPLEFVRTADLSIGQEVYSVGLLPQEANNEPYLGVGYVSAKLRAPEELIYITGGKLTSPGSPVFKADGHIVGIVGRQVPVMYRADVGQGAGTLALLGDQETSFFLPVDEFAFAMETSGKATRAAWLGIVSYEPISEEKASMLKLETPAVSIGQVIPGSAADKAGLKTLDIITALNGKPLEKLATPNLVRANFIRMLGKLKPGDEIKLTYLRGDVPQEVTIKIEEMPTMPFEAPRYYAQAIGVMVRNKVSLDRYLGAAGNADVEGVVVLGVQQGSPAGTAGLQANDVITNVNSAAVKDVDAFKNAVQNAQTLNMLIKRDGAEKSIIIAPPAVGK